jgi:hypothetical protein
MSNFTIDLPSDAFNLNTLTFSEVRTAYLDAKTGGRDAAYFRNEMERRIAEKTRELVIDALIAADNDANSMQSRFRQYAIEQQAEKLAAAQKGGVL